jgi:hypothetical protein
VVGFAAGCIVALLGLGLFCAGGALVLAHALARDDDGYYASDTKRLATPTHALTGEDIDLGATPADVLPKDVLGRVRIRAARPGGAPVFVGIGPQRQVDRYLSGVSHAEVRDLSGDPSYRTRPGARRPRPPAAQRFWVASAQGSGRQTTTWKVQGGRWAIVAMRSDGARPVAVDADVGVRIGWFLGVGIALLAVGLVVLAVGAVIIVAVARRAGRGPPATRAPAPDPG